MEQGAEISERMRRSNERLDKRKRNQHELTTIYLFNTVDRAQEFGIPRNNDIQKKRYMLTTRETCEV